MIKLSKQAIAKQEQGYCDKPVPPTCSNCKNFQTTLALKAWMVKANASHTLGRGKPYTLKFHGRPTAPRCGLGDFSTKLSATCEQFEQKKVGTK